MKLTISHLVVNGCSYTYGHGIANPIRDAWPSIVARELGVPLINLALPGQSNYKIQRRTFHYFFKDLLNHNNPFYIHAYTQSTRRDVYLAEDINREIQEYIILDSSLRNATQLEKELIRHTDEHQYNLLLHQKLIMWHSINGLLDSHKVPHFSTDYMIETNKKVLEWQHENAYVMNSELLTHPSKLTDFSKLTDRLEKTPCLHETEQGHKVIADYILEKIDSIYDSIEVVENPYAKLSSIMIMSPYITEWRKKHPDERHSPKGLSGDWSLNVYYLAELGLDWENMTWLGSPSDYHRDQEEIGEAQKP